MKKRNSPFSFAQEKRNDVEISLPDGRTIVGPRGAMVGDFLSILPLWEGSQIVGAVVDGYLRELTFKIEKDSVVRPLNMSSSDGSKIYRRSLTFLLETAFEDLFPQYFLVVDHSVPLGGYYCKVAGRQPLSKEETKHLSQRMKTYVKENVPIIRQEVDLEEAINYFKAKKYYDKLRLLKYRRKPHLVLYQLGSHRDYHHGYMVPKTGLLKIFKLLPRGNGFILQYPRRKTPDKLFTMPTYTKLLEIFKQYGSWLESLDIDSVGALNDSIENHSIREVILVSEALHEQKISQIASQIAKKADKIRIVLIAGPTSSGKTTFSKRLAIQLLTHGISPFPIEMDNYFVDREKTPLDNYGNYDFESYDAIDSGLMEIHLQKLLGGEEVQLPRYNFKTGRREKGENVRLDKNQILLVEGIHSLNPRFLSRIMKEQTFRIYVSCLTQLNLDYYNRISTTDSRMIRRIVRDARTRGFTAQRTIEMWGSIHRGEREYIFPYQENADEIFNSALVYELAALKPFAEPLLRQIVFGTEAYLEAKRLLAFLEWFIPIDVEMIPDNSILREFIGNSILEEFNLWKSSPTN